MWPLKSVSFLVFLMQVVSSPIRANEAPPPAAGAPVVEESYSGKQSQKWSEVQADLSKLKGKVDAQQIVVEGLLSSQRGHAGDSGTMSPEQVATLKLEHEKLQKLTQEYNVLLNEFDYKFPEKGLTGSRRYIRLENQSLDEIETHMSLEGRLKKLDRKIKSQYKVAPNEPTKSKVHTGVQAKPKDAKTKTEKNPPVPEQDITEKIILNK